VAGLRLRKPPVQVEHILDEVHRRRVAGDVHRGFNCYIELLKYNLIYAPAAETAPQAAPAGWRDHRAASSTIAISSSERP
jgi:hypothetical protein